MVLGPRWREQEVEGCSLLVFSRLPMVMIVMSGV